MILVAAWPTGGLGYALGPNYNKPWETFDEADLENTVARATAALARAGEADVAATRPSAR